MSAAHTARQGPSPEGGSPRSPAPAAPQPRADGAGGPPHHELPERGAYQDLPADVPGLQPLLHELVVTLAAPSVALSWASGDLDSRSPDGAATGLFHADVRALNVARLTVGGRRPTPVFASTKGVGVAHFLGLCRHLGDAKPDETVRVDRVRHLSPGVMREEIVLASTTGTDITTEVEIELASDFAPLERVKGGVRLPQAPRPELEGDAVTWDQGGIRLTVTAPGARLTPEAVRWRVHLPPRTPTILRWEARVEDDAAVVGPARTQRAWARPTVHADDRRLTALLSDSVDDLEGLQMSTPEHPESTFLAAGAPWFFTLFGRDSVWAARMMLPLGTELAHGTLVTLAGRQGSRNDQVTLEEPGKILHELRRGVFVDGSGLHLPPVYYGTVDATPLWVCLLHDAWRWGLAPDHVAALIPNLEAALGWIGRATEAGGGFIAYADPTGVGLANQAWKDSGDGIRYADGRVATPPLALSEVQGYAHEAALSGAALLEAFGRPGAERWRAWAADLARRFRSRFWCRDDEGEYPALALTPAGEPVDAVASNMGHLLGTGLLDQRETALVAARLAGPDMADGYGLRTMSSKAGGYAPLSYHCGSVWPHDTAIAIAGLARTGHEGHAAELVEGLLRAGMAFGGRLPELWSGDARSDLPAPVPYPSACRPQAWSAAGVVALLAATLGLQPDVPGGTLTIRPPRPSPVGALAVEGLRLAGRPLSVSVDAHGEVRSVSTAAAVEVVVDGGRPDEATEAAEAG